MDTSQNPIDASSVEDAVEDSQNALKDHCQDDQRQNRCHHDVGNPFGCPANPVSGGPDRDRLGNGKRTVIEDRGIPVT